jgi:aspartate/tyrosine/aromatic aminotransferase
MQALGASGACHMGALFLKLHYGPWKSGAPTRVYIPAETWGIITYDVSPMVLTMPDS